MWGLMNTALGTMRHRRGHRGGMGTMTALVVGASVGIAAWEAMRMRKSQMDNSGRSESTSSSGTASTIAEEVMREIES